MRATLNDSTTGSGPLSGQGSGAFSFLRDAWRGIQIGRAMRSEQRDVTSNLTSPEPWLLNAINGGPTKSGASVNDNTAFNVSAVRACVNFRANLLAMLPLKVYQKTDSGPKEQRDHSLARLFRGRVSGAQTRFKWIHSSSVCFDIGGTAYSRLYRDTYADIIRIQWVKPTDVTPLANKATGDIVFRVNGESADLKYYEMLQVSNLSTNGYTGRSPLLDLREAVGLALTAEEFSARSFSNGNRKPGILVPPAGWKQAQADEFREQWMKHYAGAHNAGKTPLLGGGMTWTDAGFTSAEAELLGQRKFSIEEIARVYHLPLHLIGSTDKATTWGSGIEQLNQGLVDYTLQPLCTNWEAEMNTTLLTEKEQEQGFYIKFSVDALLRGSPTTRATFYQAMRGIAAMDVNQIRRLEEWETYDRPDGVFDDPRLPMNNQGGASVAKPAPVPADNTGD